MMDPLEIETRQEQCMDVPSRQLHDALQRAIVAERRVLELKAEKRKLHDRLMQFVWVNLELQDQLEGLQRERA